MTIICISVLRGTLKSVAAGWFFSQTKPPDSYVAVSIDEQPPKKTKISEKSNNPIWDEAFTL